MLTAVMGSHRKVAEYVDDCRRLNIKVLPPDVNESGLIFTPVMIAENKEMVIRFGLAAIKNVGTQAIDSIMKEREEKPYDSLLDLCRRVDLRVCNKRVLESLLQAGAFDSLAGHRAQLLAVLDETLEAALKWKKERDELQLFLFGLEEEINWTLDYPDIRPFTIMQQLELERELLGIFLSGHPLDAYERLMQASGVTSIIHLAELPDLSEVIVAGMVISLKTIVTKKGQQMAFIELEDRVEKVEVVLFPETWKKYGSLIQKGQLVLIKAKLQQQDEDIKLLADQVVEMNNPERQDQLLLQLQQRTANPKQQTRNVEPKKEKAASAEQSIPSKIKQQRVFVKISAAYENQTILARLKLMLQEHSGPMQVVLFYEREQKMVALNNQYNVKPSEVFVRSLEALMGNGAIKVQ
jgi:DNA polymerase-3 subunit alpha